MHVSGSTNSSPNTTVSKKWFRKLCKGKAARPSSLATFAKRHRKGKRNFSFLSNSRFSYRLAFSHALSELVEFIFPLPYIDLHVHAQYLLHSFGKIQLRVLALVYNHHHNMKHNYTGELEYSLSFRSLSYTKRLPQYGKRRERETP